MAATGTLSISGSITGGATGSDIIGPLDSVIVSTVGQRTSPLDLSSGANTITVPTGSKAMVFVPPTSNTNVLTLKGVAGDTGIPISSSEPFVIQFSTAPASFVINSAGATSGCEIRFM